MGRELDRRTLDRRVQDQAVGPSGVITTRLSPAASIRFLEALEAGEPLTDCGEGDLARTSALMARYAEMKLGFADASVIACAERNGGRVMSFDRRDFEVVAAEGTIELLP